MKILGDYHTHTDFSHGKGTILENALQAKKMGLKQLGISDHGYGHVIYGIDKSDIPYIRKEIEEAELKTGLRILMGIEANFDSVDGSLDVEGDEFDWFDYIFVGFHKIVKTNFLDQFRLIANNILFGTKHVSAKRRARNTRAVCMALENNPIDALTHLKHHMPINLEEVAKKCVETHTYIELNESKMLFTKEEVDMMVKLGVQFIVSSDAHHPSKVGKFDHVMNIIKEYDIPASQIANLDKLPKFKRVEK